MKKGLTVCLILGSLAASVFIGQACTPGFKVASLNLNSGKSSGPLDEEAAQGKVLYDSKCAACHGPLETSTKLGTTVKAITDAIETQPLMTSLKGLFSAEQIRTLTLALNGEGPVPTCEVAPDSGRVGLHRLNRVEYANTLRDLLGVSTQIVFDAGLPADEYSDNFDNNARVLGTTSTHIQKYLEIAETAMASAFANNTLKARLLKTCDLNQATCVQQILTSFLLKAFRRPATTTELNAYTSLVAKAKTEGDSTEVGLRIAMTGALVSPHFIYRSPAHPSPNDPNTTVSLSDYEVASRMSYFIWSSMPDDALLEAARLGQLKTREQLTAQAKRMLKDAKAVALIDNFGAKWMRLNQIDQAQPDRTLFPTFTAELRNDLKNETRLALKDIFDRDGSFFEILTADFTYANERLANHYGLPGVSGSNYQRVSLAGQDRLGLITHGSLMVINANPDRTSIVKRGKWVLDNLLCTPPPPAPPEVVGSLPPSGGNLSIRERMELHRADPTCFSCHAQMDPIGFALENFDPLGRYRTSDGTTAIDNRGEFPDGRQFSGARELASVVTEDRRFKFCVAEKLFIYSLGRKPEAYDRCTINRIGLIAVDPQKPVSAAIVEMINSDAFRKQRGEGPR